MIYPITRKGPFKVPGFHDRDNKRFFSIIYKPDVWTPSTLYSVRNDEDYDIVSPSVPNGFYYKVTNPGTTGVTEPAWETTPNSMTTDGATFEAVLYDLLPTGVIIIQSSFVASDGVTLTNPTLNGGRAGIMIDTVPIGVSVFTITNHVVRSNGEETDVTLSFRVAEH